MRSQAKTGSAREANRGVSPLVLNNRALVSLTLSIEQTAIIHFMLFESTRFKLDAWSFRVVCWCE